jgi:hypothetical protein
MSLTLELGPEMEARVREAAAREGVDADSYVMRLLEERVPAQRNLNAIEVLKSFYDGDEEEQRETFEVLRKALGEDRPSYRKLF